MQQIARSPMLFALMAALILAEWWWRSRIARRGYDTGDARASLVMGLGNILAGALGALLLGGLFAFAYRIAPVHWPLADWRTWAVGFVGVELAYYWFHRCSHRVRWMWANHAVHHTPEEMTLLSSIRLGWTNLLSFGWVFHLPLVLAGFDPRLVFTLLALDLHYQFFLHTEAVGRLGPLEWVMNTPAHHRVHHGSNAEYLDCNYGGMVIVFDRLFGTLRVESPDNPVRYGLANPLGTKRPIVVAFGEWRRLFAAMKSAADPRAALRIALGRP